MGFGINRLAALVLTINRQNFRKEDESNAVKGRAFNSFVTELNAYHSRLYQIFQEITLLLNPITPDKQVTLQGQEQPPITQPGIGVITFDFTLKRFQASENGYKYFDAYPREGCRLTNNAPVAIPNNAATAVPFPFERYDPFNMHNTAVNNTKITILRTGNYVVGGCIEYAAAAGGSRKVFVRKNGTTNVVGNSTLSLGAGEDTVISTECIYQFVVGDYIELIAFQNSGGPINANAAGDYTPEFWAGRIHDQPV